MKKYNKYFILFLITAMLIILQACSKNQDALDTPAPEETAYTEQQGIPVDDIDYEPYSFNDDAVIQPDILQYLFTFDYDDYVEYNEHFFDIIQVDLDGDGAKETIELLPGRQNKDSTYASIFISIDGKEIKLEADSGWSIGYGDSIIGTIVDIDKDDAYKELIIYQQADFDTANEYLEKSCVIVYADKEPKVLAAWDDVYEANGSGYVAGQKYTKQLAGDYAIALLHVKKYVRNVGFEEINSSVYGVLNYSSQIIGQQTKLLTQWDQYVAIKPETDPNIMIKKDTRIHFGLYHESGWIEVYSVDGSAVGWLDLNVVDIDRYIDNAIEASCH